MVSNRPYLIRAINDWLVDSQCTPHLLVNADVPGVEVPQEHVKDGKITLNIGPQAVEGLLISNEEVSFMARFGGVSRAISFPVSAVLAIFARENGYGMAFNETEEPSPDDPGPKRPSLKVVK
jgi:stringent starvation protein B